MGWQFFSLSLSVTVFSNFCPVHAQHYSKEVAKQHTVIAFYVLNITNKQHNNEVSNQLNNHKICLVVFVRLHLRASAVNLFLAGGDAEVSSLHFGGQSCESPWHPVPYVLSYNKVCHCTNAV